MDGIGAVLVSQPNINSVNNTGKGKSVENANFSFIDSVKSVVKGHIGAIAVFGGSDLEELDFLKRKFGYEIKLPEKLMKNPYDFIAEIKKILREKKKG